MSIDLELPDRTSKPRATGQTMVIDHGEPTRYFEDAINSYGEYIDLVKFGWATALVSKDIKTKMSVLQNQGIRFCFGGTMFEKFVSQGRFDAFVELCREYKVTTVEISNGTITMSNTEKSEYITKLGDEFEVVSEVGFKDGGRSDEFTPDEWVTCIKEDMAAGSTMVITESRESGTAGIANAKGELRMDVIDDIMNSGIDIDHVLFEAPNKGLQTLFIKQVGANVNLGNIAVDDVIGLETLRLGLRSDTLLAFDK